MPPVTISEPEGGDVDRGRTVSIIILTQVAFAFLIVVARFYARIMIKGIGKDDWAMLFTLVGLSLCITLLIPF